MVEGARIPNRGKEERAIRLRSTGLGKTELVARADDLKRQGNHLVLSVKTTEPVSWHDLNELLQARMTTYDTFWTIVRWLTEESEVNHRLNFPPYCSQSMGGQARRRADWKRKTRRMRERAVATPSLSSAVTATRPSPLLASRPEFS